MRDAEDVPTWWLVPESMTKSWGRTWKGSGTPSVNAEEWVPTSRLTN
jgi:hypothetical protein